MVSLHAQSRRETLFGTMIDLGNPHSCGNNNESGSTFKRNLNSIARNHYSGIFDGIVDFASYPGLGADRASSGQVLRSRSRSSERRMPASNDPNDRRQCKLRVRR